MKQVHMKSIDDITAAVSIDINNTLVRNPEPNPARPLQYHDRNQHILPG